MITDSIERSAAASVEERGHSAFVGEGSRRCLPYTTACASLSEHPFTVLCFAHIVCTIVSMGEPSIMWYFVEFLPCSGETWHLIANAATLDAMQSTCPSRADKPLKVQTSAKAGANHKSKGNGKDWCRGWLCGEALGSEAFQECHVQHHAQYHALPQHARANDGFWFRSWPVAKGAIAKAKPQILEAARKKGQDIMISDIGPEPAELRAFTNALKTDGYTANLCCIFADPQDIVQRGVAREFAAGKRCNRGLARLGKCFDAFPAAVRAVNSACMIVRNAHGHEQEVYLQGHGGSDIAFDLDRVLAWPPEPRGAQATVEPCDVTAADVAFVMEGIRDVVFAYSGADPALQGSSIRCLKVDSEDALRGQAPSSWIGAASSGSPSRR